MIHDGSCAAQLLKIAHDKARRSVVDSGSASETEDAYVNIMGLSLEREGYINLNVAGHEVDDTEHEVDDEMIA